MLHCSLRKIFEKPESTPKATEKRILALMMLLLMLTGLLVVICQFHEPHVTFQAASRLSSLA